MGSRAREYIDFWIENSVHAGEPSGPGASQDVSVLLARLIEGAEAQGITATMMQDEVGDLAEYVRGKLRDANRTERYR